MTSRGFKAKYTYRKHDGPGRWKVIHRVTDALMGFVYKEDPDDKDSNWTAYDRRGNPVSFTSGGIRGFGYREAAAKHVISITLKEDREKALYDLVIDMGFEAKDDGYYLNDVGGIHVIEKVQVANWHSSHFDPKHATDGFHDPSVVFVTLANGCVLTGFESVRAYLAAALKYIGMYKMCPALEVNQRIPDRHYHITARYTSKGVRFSAPGRDKKFTTLVAALQVIFRQVSDLKVGVDRALEEFQAKSLAE